MADDKNRGALLPISGVLVVLAALGVTIFTQPFKGSRPVVPETRESYEKVNARLWQDPFRAVMDGVKGSDAPQSAGQLDIEKSHPGQKQKTGPSLSAMIKGNKNIKILGVMVPGAPYAEDTEIRMRLRYAALAGLSRVGFAPDDPEHVEYIKLAPFKGTTLLNILPFEWLKHRDKEDDAVLVLWLNENSFQKSPLTKLARLAEYLRDAMASQGKKAKFRIIGPAQSSTLKDMITEADKYRNDSQSLKPLRGAEIYSAMATVDNEQLMKGKEDESPVRGDREKVKKTPLDEMDDLFKRQHVGFFRTIGSDRGLADLLVKELKHRSIDLKEKKGFFTREAHLLLVAEWDTYYGRSFQKSLDDALVGQGVDRGEVDRRVHMISYLRGIDGSLPGEKEEKKDEKDAKNDPLSDIKKLEPPVGKSQYDYLRRLAEATFRFDENLQANGGEIKAIGVMGTDFYDKYLVLQALRQRFPDIVFFTTDLDARYLHPDHFKWTRNLVVASNFGLSLQRDDDLDIQGEIPPFRDSYQTSVFWAVLKAFRTDLDRSDSENDKKVASRVAEYESPPPLVFEIGRHEAAVFTPTKNSPHPQKERTGYDARFILRICAMAVLAIIFFFFANRDFNMFLKRLIRSPWKLTVAVMAGALLFVALPWTVHHISGMEGEEPFSLFGGISVWPTELLRLLAILLSVFFIYRTWKDRIENTRSIEKDFGFAESAGDLKDVWSAYICRDTDRKHIWRVSLMTAFYMAFCSCIVSFDLPVSPLRGAMTFWIDKFFVMMSVVCLIGLISYVFDVTRCCRRFISIASRKIEARAPGLTAQAQIEGELNLVRLIARRTDTVGKFIFYPLIVWFLIFISRFDYLDNWRTPVGLAVVVSLGALYAWSSAYLLRRAAERARTFGIERLRKLLLSIHSRPEPDGNMIKRLEFVLEEIHSNRQGAFAPFAQRPVVQSLIVPFGGVGGVYLIDFLTKFNV